jgi:hypothetical protein
MKINAAKHAVIRRPFYSDDKLEITTLYEANKITGWVVDIKGKGRKEMKVKGNDILGAWKEVEKYTKGLKYEGKPI